MEMKLAETGKVMLTVMQAFSSRRKTTPLVAEPMEICAFSQNKKGDRLPAVLRKYKRPLLPLDLNKDYNGYSAEDDIGATSNIKNVLDTLQEHHIDLKGSIVSYRNNMNKILCSPYSKDPWEMDVSRQNDTIFLGVRQLDRSINAFQAKTMYWGRKFEEECSERLDPDDVQFCSIVKTRLNQKRLILAAEIDCYEERILASSSSSRKSGDEEESERNRKTEKTVDKIELKTYRLVNGKNDYPFRKNKLLHFWVQSFIAGVPRIICGFRDDEGVVRQLETYNTMDIPKMAGDAWDYHVCLHFADQLLDGLWKHTQEGQKYVLKFWAPYESAQLFSYVKEG